MQLPGFVNALSGAGVDAQTCAGGPGEPAAGQPDVDLLHYHGCPDRIGGGLLRGLAARRLPHLISPYGLWTRDETSNGRWWQRIFGGPRGMVLPAGTCIHATSRAEADHLRNRGFTGRIEVLPMGVDPGTTLAHPTAQTTAGPPAELSLPPDHRILLYLGPLDDEPGLPAFLKACDDLEDDLAGWRIVLAGSVSKTWREAFAASARRHGKSDLVTLVPSPSAKQQSELLRAADVLVSPIAGDRPAVDALQAMACGVPVVVAATAGLDEVAGRNAGRVCPVERSALRQALAELVTLPAEKLREMGAEGRKLVDERFAWPALVPRYVDLYRSLLM